MHVPQQHTYATAANHDYMITIATIAMNYRHLNASQSSPRNHLISASVRPVVVCLVSSFVRSFVRSFVATSLGVREFRDRRIRRSSFVVRSFVVRSFVRRLSAVVGGQSDEIPIMIVLQYVPLHNRLSACFGRGYVGVAVRKDTLWKYGV